MLPFTFPFYFAFLSMYIAKTDLSTKWGYFPEGSAISKAVPKSVIEEWLKQPMPVVEKKAMPDEPTVRKKDR